LYYPIRALSAVIRITFRVRGVSLRDRGSRARPAARIESIMAGHGVYGAGDRSLLSPFLL